ncbi:hypothetical protein FRC0190_01907 [Corynebacterium rouxii]|uniref:Uncharacterized protein n=1 Tax=Corynebacterium rouxii TaxID=2719119 RepID=A0A6I8ME05_9CORY|nr:hypothetical protein FRC0190_01907 [Corynebacterium rouxii]
MKTLMACYGSIFPKGTDLSIHTIEELESVAM